MKAQGNIIAPADPAVAATHIKLMIGTVTAPVKKKCAAIPETMKSRYCGAVLSGGCNQVAGGGEVGKSPYEAMRPGTRMGGIESYGEGSVPDAIP